MSILDRYENAIDNPPHYDLIVGPDGVPLPNRRTARLATGLTATDQPDSNATLVGLNASSAGLSVLSAADAAAQRAALGIVDLTSMDSAELAHANTVCGFANPSYGARLDFINLADALSSPWHFNAGTSGAQSLSVTGSGSPGVLYTTGALSTNLSLITATVTVDGPSWGDDLVDSTDKWHVRWYFRLATTPTANTIMGMGWVSTDASTIGPVVGTNGSEGHFCFMKIGGGTVTRSTIPVDTTNNHKVDMWTNGTAGTVFFSFDNETPIAVTGCTFGKLPCPFFFFQCTDVGAAQQAILRRAYYRVDGDVAA